MLDFVAELVFEAVAEVIGGLFVHAVGVGIDLQREGQLSIVPQIQKGGN